MRDNLALREKLYGELFPWDSPNYGMDEYWVRCYPYEQDAAPGGTVDVQVVITNHSASQCQAVCRPILPASWGNEAESKSISISAKSEGQITFSFTIPEDALAKRIVIPVDVTYAGRSLGQCREAILVVE